MQEKINTANCEAYFLLYVDNELSSTKRAEVEQFLQQHPDMSSLLEALLRTRQNADPDVVFPDKSKLFFDVAPVTDEDLLSYVDKETVSELVLQALQHPSPELVKRLQAFENTVSEPDMKIVFPDKSRLYRTRKLVAFKSWTVAAAAAVVIIAVGAGIWLQSSRKGQESLAGADHPRDTTPQTVIARVVPEKTPADTMPTADNAGKKAAVTPDMPADYRAGRVMAKKEVQKATPEAVPPSSVARQITTAPQQPAPVPRKADLLPQPETRPIIAKKDPAPPAAPEQDLPEPAVAAITGDEKQPKAKKSLFKKLTQRIEERVTETLTDNEGQVTIAGFAVNVK